MYKQAPLRPPEESTVSYCTANRGRMIAMVVVLIIILAGIGRAGQTLDPTTTSMMTSPLASHVHNASVGRMTPSADIAPQHHGATHPLPTSRSKRGYPPRRTERTHLALAGSPQRATRLAQQSAPGASSKQGSHSTIFPGLAADAAGEKVEARGGRRLQTAVRDGLPRISVVLQYFKMPGNIPTLLSWTACDGVELIVNVDSHMQSDLAWLSGTATHVVFSQNIHELRAYNKLVHLASAPVVVFVQDDQGPPRTCDYVDHTSQMFVDDPSLAVIGMLGAVDAVVMYNDYRRHTVRRWRRGGFDAEYVGCVDIGPFIVQKEVFISLGKFDEGFSVAGQGAAGLDTDFSIRTWIANYSVALYKPSSLQPNLEKTADGRLIRPKASRTDKSRQIVDYRDSKIRSYSIHEPRIRYMLREKNERFTTRK